MSVFLGVDVARYGSDATAVSIWKGKRLDLVQTMRGLDTMAVADHVAGLIAEHSPQRVCVDVIGLGSGVVDRLKQLRHHMVVGVNVAAGSRSPDKFKNLRAHVYWTFREALQRGEVSLPRDRELFEELTALKYFYVGSGALQIESKDELRKRIGRSCDRADAVVLGFWAVGGAGGFHWNPNASLGSEALAAPSRWRIGDSGLGATYDDPSTAGHGAHPLDYGRIAERAARYRGEL